MNLIGKWINNKEISISLKNLFELKSNPYDTNIVHLL